MTKDDVEEILTAIEAKQAANQQRLDKLDRRADKMLVVGFILGMVFGLGICWGSS